MGMFDNVRCLYSLPWPAEETAKREWQSKDTPGNNATGVAQTHNHVLCYRRSEQFSAQLLTRTAAQEANYSNPDNDNRGPWLAAPLTRGESSPDATVN